jgi:hypothetical protein
MTRTDHFAHSTPGFPVFSLGFLSDRTVVLGGGGGSSKSGVKNKLVRRCPPFPFRLRTWTKKLTCSIWHYAYALVGCWVS